jgi:hypothetical protein
MLADADRHAEAIEHPVPPSTTDASLSSSSGTFNF